MSDNDKEVQEIMRHITAAEAICKTHLIEYCDEHLGDNRDKIAVMGMASIGMAVAAIHAAKEAASSNGNTAIGEMVVATLRDVMTPELKALVEAMQKVRDGRK